MSSVAKMYVLNNGYLDLATLNGFINDYHESTKLSPNVVKISRKAFASLTGTVFGTAPVVLEAGKNYAFHLPCSFGILPLLSVNEQMTFPNGFVTIDDTKFDEKFEKIVLTGEDE